MLDAGYLSPKEFQTKTISRMVGGQNIIGIGPESCGKSTALILAVLMRLKAPVDGAPRALILTATKEKAEALTAQFKWLGKNTGIRTSCLTTGLTGDYYLETIEDGLADIVIGTPDKTNALYVKSTLNLRSLMIFVVDDAEAIFKSNLQASVYNISEGLTKCQRLVFSDVLNEKLDKLAELLMPNAVLIDVPHPQDKDPGTIDMILYKTSNYKIKLNLLELLLRDNTITKAVIFVNTRAAAETLYNTLKKRLGKNIGILNHGSFNNGFDSLESIKQTPSIKLIVLCNEDQPSFNLLNIAQIIHLEIPLEKDIFLDRVKKLTDKENDSPLSISFATNAELELIKKIEQAAGKTILLKELPFELTTENASKKNS